MATDKGITVSLDELLALQEPARYISDALSSHTRSMLQGNRPSKMHGRGGAFEQIRHYLAGDDVRSIDWKVTARVGKPFVRVFTEERERPLLVLVDQSADMFFATRNQLKSVAAARIAAFLLWMSFNNKRPCGAVLFNEQSQTAQRPRANKGHLHGLLTELEGYNRALPAVTVSGQDTGLQAQNALLAGLQQLNRILTRDAMVVLISDFQQVNDGCWELIERLSQRANLIATPVYDGIADDLPDNGQFLASYTGLEAELDFSSQRSREAISTGIQNRLQALSLRFAELGIPSLGFSTFRDVEAQLLSGLFIDGGQDG